MQLINRRKLFENDKYVIEQEGYEGWISRTYIISIYKKIECIDDLYPAWREMFIQYLSGKNTSQDKLFKKIQNHEEILFEEMSWDLRDIDLSEVKTIIKEDYDIELR